MKKYLSIILVAIAATSLTSCLKDGKVNLPPGGSPAVIEFSTTLVGAPVSDVNSPVGVFGKAFDVVPTATLEVRVHYTGGGTAPEDITVNLNNEGTDEIAAYNEYDESEYEEMPSNLVSGMPTSVVIKKGESFGKFTLTFTPDQFDFTKAYVLPLRITSVSSGTVSGNFGTILLNVGVKNRVDGLYSYKTSATTSLQPNKNDKGVPLVTAGPNSVTTNLLNTYSNIIKYDIDPVTNKVTVVSVTPTIGAPITDPISNYDPATKVMHVKWTAGSRQFEETYTYSDVRP